MPNKIIQLNEDLIKHNSKDLVRNNVQETLNALPIRKPPNQSTLKSISTPLNARDIVLVTISEISTLSFTSQSKMKTVALMLKTIHAQESKDAAREKALQVSEKLRSMKLAKAAKR